METLFDVAPVTVNGFGGRASTAQLGRATEFRVMAILLERGIVPSEPLTDESGCDLLVNGLRVQVKSCRAFAQPRGRPGNRHYTFTTKRGWRADVYVFRGVEDDVWWVIPHAELVPFVRVTGHAAISLSPVPQENGQGRPNRSRVLDRFRDAWWVFDAAE